MAEPERGSVAHGQRAGDVERGAGRRERRGHGGAREHEDRELECLDHFERFRARGKNLSGLARWVDPKNGGWPHTVDALGGWRFPLFSGQDQVKSRRN